MEVLEHVVAVDAVIDRLWRLLADEGTLLVSVPVETGVPLLLKQAARRIAGWRGIGDYPGTSPVHARASTGRAVFAGRRPHLKRPVYGIDTPMPFHDHKGFNWMALRDRLARRFDDRTRGGVARAVARAAPGDAGLVRGTEDAAAGGRMTRWPNG